MNLYGTLPLAVILNCAVLVICKSYYSILAPGVIKSNRKYYVSVSLHEADEPAVINVRVQGPSYNTAQDVELQPYETKTVSFLLPKLAYGDHKLIAEGVSGIEFRNESTINADVTAGPKIYIQTDKAIYKPGDVVQFRCLLLDEHTRPLYVKEPIRVEIFDGKKDRVKQFKDISLVKGVYKGKFELSEYPVLGSWEIKVIISGKYDFSGSKTISVSKYVLPKFSVYIEADDNFILEDGVLKARVYGKYTFGKYVEGNLTATVTDNWKVYQEKRLTINSTADLEFQFDKTDELKKLYTFKLKVSLTERHTGLTRSHFKNLQLRKQRFDVKVDYDSVKYQYHKPYSLTAHVQHWNGSLDLDHKTPVIMQHGSKEYEAYLDSNGDAKFEFDHERDADHVFRYKDSSYTFSNIFVNEHLLKNETVSYCRLRLKGDRPRLGTKMEIEVNSTENIPYINYVMVGHGNIIKNEHISVPANRTSYIIEITPSIEMIPLSYIYVYYVQNGNLRYNELKFIFPWEFENRVSVMAPKQVKPGQNVTIELKAQPKSYVGLMAVDLAVYLLDSSYDLKRIEIFQDLYTDATYIPLYASVYPGLLSGVVTLTNAHYLFVPEFPGPQVNSIFNQILDFREKFPETWIFDNYEITNETTQLALTVPDSITTWRLTAFTVNDITGFGIVDGPTDIIAIQKFFIVLNLPYSVKRGEIVTIPVIVHNYHNQSVEAKVIIHNQEQEFYFLESSALDMEKGSEEQQRVKHVSLPANGIVKVEFLINPRRVGKIKLQITAENALSNDAVIQELKVEPEGVVKQGLRAIYARLPNGGSFTHSFEVDIPQDIVPDSELITLTVGGDSLVPTLKNLNDLVILPTGCGEQNMINFAPNVLVLEYLKASGNYFKEQTLVQKATNFIEMGYQQQLSYRHKNGGFSAFGPNKDEEACTWLTAYVIRFFIKALNYLAIEPEIITSGLEFLANEQFENGDFLFTGYLFYPAQQNRYCFTAFVLMTFLENEKYASKYQNVIQKGLSFLNENLDKIKHIYPLSITATALQMAKHENAQKVIEKLKMQKREKDSHVWWSQNDANLEKDVEVTAYVLLALLQNDNDPTEDHNILNWLVDQRSVKGGFRSTHDTVVGLQALVKFSEKYGNAKNKNMKIQYTAKNRETDELATGDLKVNAYNMLVLQAKELPPSTRVVDVKITGSGFSLIQLSHQYHVATDDRFKYFQLQPTPQLLNDEEMQLDVCFNYLNETAESPDASSTSNMIIMEVNLPSGFTTSDNLLEYDIIQRTELKNSETTLVAYLEKLTAYDGHCLNILAAKVHDVLRRKPAVISLYDYYNITRHETAFYNV